MIAWIAYAIFAFVWYAVCALASRPFRRAAWMAGHTVTSAAWFLGLTLATTFMYPRGLWLLPLWIAVGAVLAVHLKDAMAHARPARLRVPNRSVFRSRL